RAFHVTGVQTCALPICLFNDEFPNRLYFSYANTVATIDFAKKFKGHGWVGIRFQIEPKGAYNEIILHIQFKETDARLQQHTLGKIGSATCRARVSTEDV